MNLINGYDYNVTIETPHYLMKPMRADETEQLLALCAKEGFSYPYIHTNPKTQHLPLAERVASYTAIGEACATGQEGRSLVQSVYSRANGEFLGATILYEVQPGGTLFGNVMQDKAWEVGFFVDIDHWKQHIATETLYHIVQYGTKYWGLEQLHASVEPTRQGSLALCDNFGLEFVEHIEPGSSRVPYNDEEGNPAARIILRTPEDWDFNTSIRLKPDVLKLIV